MMVVFPASGWEMMAKVLRRAISWSSWAVGMVMAVLLRKGSCGQGEAPGLGKGKEKRGTCDSRYGGGRRYVIPI
ncbi:hypothetical protein GCM10025871_00450 [Deinococcus metallilatus]|nr:hypothetical protein GCM10025871_00450 [Deinococcus metallilatus]